MGGHKLTRAEQTLIIRSIMGILASGVPLRLEERKSVGSVPSRIVYFRLNKPITLSTWILTLAMPLVRSTSTGCNCDFPLVNAGITNLACFRPTLSQIVNPRSAMTMSPGSRFLKTHSSQSSTCLRCGHPKPQTQNRQFLVE